MEYICSKCGRIFTNAGAKTIHERVCDGTIKQKKIYSDEELIFVCECGKKFHSKNSLSAHGIHCKQYKKKEKVSKYKIADDLYRCECGREFSNFQSMNAHFGHCEEHRKILGKQKREYEHTNHWENLSTERKQEIGKKAGKTLSNNIKNGTTVPTWKGRHHTEENKRKIREGMAKYFENNGYGANTSEKACVYIDRLNEQNHWNLQHAKNGGEIVVCGYYLDGYDKERNIVVEYDEPYHYIDVYNNILREKDIKRQNEIIKEINPIFYRYNQKIDLLYKINNGPVGE